ncbi:hypothetical protein pipiens_007789 [Culex pipiens pipiens]|uniref:C2H2-type domain-containing protein n=2 Tax=Culex pipiens TaxID=7175 RepID=A0ABD1DJU0_CULPP
MMGSSSQQWGMNESKQFHTCSECHRQFCSMNAMKRHKLAKHGDNKVSYSCAMCNAIFKTKWSLSTHKSKYHRDKVMVLPVKAEPEVQQPQQISQPVATSTPVAITVRKMGGQATATVLARKSSAGTSVIP